MATFFNDLSLAMFAGETFRPQSFTSTGAGLTVDVSTVGNNLLNAKLEVGAVSSLTSLAVKIQASTDDSSWDDISGATFTTVTAANQTETISFQMPKASSTTANPYKYVRAYATISGTSALIHCAILGLKRMPNSDDGYLNSPPTIN